MPAAAAAAVGHTSKALYLPEAKIIRKGGERQCLPMGVHLPKAPVLGQPELLLILCTRSQPTLPLKDKSFGVVELQVTSACSSLVC